MGLKNKVICNLNNLHYYALVGLTWDWKSNIDQHIAMEYFISACFSIAALCEEIPGTEDTCPCTEGSSTLPFCKRFLCSKKYAFDLLLQTILTSFAGRIYHASGRRPLDCRFRRLFA